MIVIIIMSVDLCEISSTPLCFESKQIHFGWNSSWVNNNARIFLFTDSVRTLPVECCSGRVLVSKGVSQLRSSHSFPPAAEAHLTPRPWQSQHVVIVLFCLISVPFGFPSTWHHDKYFQKLSSEYISDILYQAVWRVFFFFVFFSCELLNATVYVDGGGNTMGALCL